MEKISKYIHVPLWLFLLLSVVLILRVPTFFEPYNYGDEMIYLALGEGVRQGKVLYLDIHDNKPPLLYYTAALAGNLFWFKSILLLWHLGTVIVFWKLTQNLAPKKLRFQKVSTALFALLTTLPLLEGNIVNAELFMIGPTIGAFLLLLEKKHSLLKMFSAGILFSIATLFKVPALFDIPVIFVFLLVAQKFTKGSVVAFFKTAFIVFVGYITPIAVTFIYYYFRGALPDYIAAAYFQNVGYLSSWRPSDQERSFLEKNAPLLLRAGITFMGTLVLVLSRKRLSKTFLLASLWMLFSLFAVTLSERPYPHYLIQSVPALSLLLGVLLTSRTMEQLLVILPLLIFFSVPVYYKYWYYKTTPYYVRFVNLLTGNISQETYLRSFDGNAIRNYKVASYIQTLTERKEPVFVWGNSSTIYALSRRLPPLKFVADYHISDFANRGYVIKELQDKPPKVVVVLPDAPQFAELNKVLTSSYILVQTIEEAEVWFNMSTQFHSFIAPK